MGDRFVTLAIKSKRTKPLLPSYPATVAEPSFPRGMTAHPCPWLGTKQTSDFRADFPAQVSHHKEAQLRILSVLGQFSL